MREKKAKGLYQHRQIPPQGASASARTRWTDMTPLHVASFFGCARVVEVLVKRGKADLAARCADFEGATALHLAAFGMCISHSYSAHIGR